MAAWKPKDPEERFALKFDFSSELLEITTTQIIVIDKKGKDINPENICDGDPQIEGPLVLQRVKDGIDRSLYSFRCTASDDVETWVIVQDLPVRIKK